MLTILDSATAAAVAAATTQQAQATALIAAWGGGNVTVQLLAGTSVLSTLVQAPWQLTTGSSPRVLTIGARISRAFTAAGSPTRAVFVAGGVNIFEINATGFVTSLASIERLSTQVAASTSLPVSAPPPPAPPPAPSLTLTAPSPASGMVGTAAVGGVLTLVNGVSSVGFTLGSTPSATLSPASGTIVPGVPVPYTITALAAAVHTIAVSNNAGLTPPSPVIFTAAPAPGPTPPPPSGPATGVTLQGPIGGVVNQASTVFTAALTPVGGTQSGSVVVTPSSGAGGGSFTPATVTLTQAAPSATFTYTPTTAGDKTISATNNAGLTNPANLTYTAAAAAAAGLMMTGAGAAALGLPSEPIYVLATATLTADVLVVPAADDGAGGTFTPASLTLTPAIPSGSFNYTPARSGVVRVRVSNNAGLANPLPQILGVSEAFTLPAGKPAAITTPKGDFLKNVLFRRMHDEGRYERFQRVTVLDASGGQMTHAINLRGHVLEYGNLRPVEGSSYSLLVDGVQVETTTTTAGTTIDFSFSLNVTSIAAGWHVLSITGMVNGEVSWPLPVYVKKAAFEADPVWMPASRVPFDMNFDDRPHVIEWVPARFKPQIVPLDPRSNFETFNTYLPSSNFWRETLVIGHNTAPTRRPNRTLSGVLNTSGAQSYDFSRQTAALPLVQCIDGPRGIGTFGLPTHIAPATAAPNGVLRRTVYVLDPWALRKIHEDGYVETLLGYRHKNYASHFEETPVVYYPAGQSSTPDGGLELVGNWDAIPAARRGLHEAWGFCWDPRTLATNTGAQPVVGQGGDQPHTVGPAGFIADTQNNRVLKFQFEAGVRREPVITEFCVSTPDGVLDDPWDIVFDPADNTLIISERKRHRIIKINANTGAFVSVLVQGQAFGVIGNGRSPDLNPSTTLAQARVADVVLPEGLALSGGYCYFGSLLLRQVRRVHLTTGVVSVAVSETGSTGSYIKIAVSDGTFGPLGTVFVASWSAGADGYPIAYYGDGTTGPQGGNYGQWFLNDNTNNTGRRGRGEDGNKIGGISNYNSTVGVFAGRMVFAGSGEGVYELTKQKATDPTGALNTTDAALQFVYYSVSGVANWHKANALDLVQPPSFYYGSPIPWGLNANYDGALAHAGWRQTAVVLTQPVSASVSAGSEAAFRGVARGPGVVAYQWQLSTNAGATWANVTGATGAYMSVENTIEAWSGYQYRFIASVQGGLTVTSSAATLTVTSALPGWVPATVGVAGLVPMTNTLDSTNNAAGVWNVGGNGPVNLVDYSGGVYNPYYSTLGGMVVHGGGHASSQDNAVYIANFSTLLWVKCSASTDLQALGKYVVYSPPLFGLLNTSYDYFIFYGSNSTGWNDPSNVALQEFPTESSLNRCEVAPNYPGSAHTYDSMIIQPPSAGGGNKGSLIRVISSAVGTGAAADTGWSHKMDFDTGVWTRFSTNRATMGIQSGTAAVYDPTRAKAWAIKALGTSAPSATSSLSMSTGAWTNGASPAFPGGSYVDNNIVEYHALRDIVIQGTCDAVSGSESAKFYWFAGASDGTLRTLATWTNGAAPIHFNSGRGTLCDVPELGKLFYYSRINQDTYYLITVPADPANAWTWEAVAITGAYRPSLLVSPTPASSLYHRMDYAPILKSVVWATGSPSGSSVTFGGRVTALRIVA